jgi:diacylglycerol kinase family enzyme
VERGADLVLAAGGDGTLNEVVNGLAGTEVPLGLIPAGTANVCAHEIGIGNDPFAALRGFEGWVERRVALGYVEPAGAEARYFLLMAGLGFDAGTVRAVRPVWKRAVGKLAYYLAGIENLVRAPLEPILAESEWGRHEGTFLLASRVRNYGGDFNIATEAHLLREDLELVNFTAREPAAYLAYLGAVALRRVAGFPGIEIRHLTRLEAQAANGRPVRIQVDGELHGELPARITVKREALTLLVPEGYPNG